MAIKVRVLVDTHIGGTQVRCNDVLELDDAAAKDAVAAGWADDNPAAVAYAESIAPQPE